LGTTEAAWPSFTGPAAPDCAVVCIVTTVNWGATALNVGPLMAAL
jgi:hypothetical protein